MSKLFTFVGIFLLGIYALSAQNQIFWGSQIEQNIKAQTVGNTNTDTIVTQQGKVRRITVHHPDQQIYWAAGTDGKIRKSNFDGSSSQDVLSVSNAIGMVALDEGNNLLYYTETGTGNIYSVNTDGTNKQTLISGTGSVQGLTIDTANKHIYWTENDSRKIKRAGTNGSNTVTILSTNIALYDLKIDPDNQHIYFSNRTNNKIQRVNYDGTHLVDVLSVSGIIGSISIDLRNKKIAWIERKTSIGSIGQANLDGTNPQQIAVDPINSISGAAIYVNPISDPHMDIDDALSNPYHIFLSPNPLQDQLHISHDSQASLDLRIYDMKGSLLHVEGVFTQKSFLDVSAIPAGTYLIVLEIKGKPVFSRKMLKQ